MKAKAVKLFVTISLVIAVMAGAAVAQTSSDGLASVLSSQGLTAFGQAILDAARAVFSSFSDPADIQAALTSIMNDATVAAGNNDQAIRYAIVAIMQAGGQAGTDLTTAAINASQAATRFSDMTSRTISEARTLLNAGGGSGQQGTGETGGGNEDQQAGGGGSEDQQAGGGGGEDQQSGGGAGKLFNLEIDATNPFGGGGSATPGSDDNDVDITPV